MAATATDNGIASETAGLVDIGSDTTRLDTSEEMFLTREELLALDDAQFEIVKVPEWGGKLLRVKGLTGSERDMFEVSITRGKGKNAEVNIQYLRAKLVALTVVDRDGNRVFRNEDVVHLGKKSAAALGRVYDVASRLCGLSDKDAEELAGNLGKDPGAGLPSV